MPATVADARDLLIASVLCDDPVMFIDDRWLYAQTDELGPVRELNLADEGPRVLRPGRDVTVVASSYSTLLAMQAAEALAARGIEAEVVDLRVINPFDPRVVVESVRKTGRVVAVDGSWRTCGMAAEVIASVVEQLPVGALRANPLRVSLPDAPAPTSRVLEAIYYPEVAHVSTAIAQVCR